MNARTKRIGLIVLALFAVALAGFRLSRVEDRREASRAELGRLVANVKRANERSDAAGAAARLAGNELRRLEARRSDTTLTDSQVFEALRRKIDELRTQSASEPDPEPYREPPNGPHGYLFPELIGDPTYVAAVKAMQAPGLERFYAPFLLSLTKSKQTDLLDLLVEQTLVGPESTAIAEREGIDVTDRAKMSELQMRIKAESFSRIETLLSKEEQEAYRRFESLRHQLQSLERLAQRLSYTEQPLTLADLTKLAALMKNQQITPEFVAAAQPLLTPMQWEELRTFVSPAPTPAAKR